MGFPMALLGVTALYFLTFVWVSWGYLRRRDPLLRDVMLVFATIATLFGLGVYQLVNGPPPLLVSQLFTMFLVGQPYLTLRLVSQLRRVPRRLRWTALFGWVASCVPILASPPLPMAVGWLIVGYFFTVDAVSAWLLGRAAWRRGGAARVRLACAAGGTALIGTALLAAAAPVASRMLAVVSGLLYVLAFLPPRWLRRSWSAGTAYRLMGGLLAAPADEPADRTWQRYRAAAREILGADDVVVLLPAEPGSVHPATASTD